MKTLKEIYSENNGIRTLTSLGKHINRIWSKLPQIIDKKIINKLTENEIKIAELKFSILLNEVQYNKELAELIKMSRSYCVTLKDDQLPQFNRRHILLLFKRLKKYSDEMLRTVDRNWTNSNESVCLNPDLILPLLDNCSGTSYAMACVAFVDMLDEMRKLVKRNAKKEELFIQVYSTGINCERVLAPLQRLTSLRAILKRIRDEEIITKELHKIIESLDNITGILDRCYEVLTSLHGPNYVADLDNILDFSLKLLSIKYLNNKGDLSSLHQSGCNFDKMPSVDTIKFVLMEKEKGTLRSLSSDDVMRRKKFLSSMSRSSMNSAGTTSTMSSMIIDEHPNELLPPMITTTRSTPPTLRHQLHPQQHVDYDDADDTQIFEFIELPTISTTPATPVAGASAKEKKKLKKKQSTRTQQQQQQQQQQKQRNSNRNIGFRSLSADKTHLLNTMPKKDKFSTGSLNINEPEENLYEEIQCFSTSRPIENDLYSKWVDLAPTVQNGAVDKLNGAEISLKEAKYEIITSENSYLKSLRQFMTLFYNSAEIKATISEKEFNYIFGNFPKVIECSENFLQDLLRSLEGDLYLTNITKTVRLHAQSCFKPYVVYCSKYPNIIQLLEHLWEENVKFREAIISIERHNTTVNNNTDIDRTNRFHVQTVANTSVIPNNNSIYNSVGYCTFQSYLILPCQRVTRLPLLIQSILVRELPGTIHHDEALLALNALHQLAEDCNEAVREAECLQYNNKENIKQLRSKTTKSSSQDGIRKKISLKFTGLFSI